MSQPSEAQEHPPDQTPVTAVVIGLPFAEKYRAPRLQIIHLLLWTALTAVLLKVHVAQRDVMQSGPHELVIAGDAFLTALASGSRGS